MKKPSHTGRREARTRVVVGRAGAIELKSIRPRLGADTQSALRSVANRPRRVIAQLAVNSEATAPLRVAPVETPVGRLPPRASRFAPIDIAAVVFVAAPLLATAAYMIMKPDGLADAVSRALALSRTKPTIVAAEAPPAAPVSLKSATDAIAIVDGPDAEIMLSDPSSGLVPAIAAESEDYAGRDRRCELDDAAQTLGLSKLASLTPLDQSTEDFGQALASAALAQTREFVVYKDSYKRLKFPLGDVSALFGVCTDVIIRAYRAVGVDLQSLVHRSGVGRGDTSIDHRRTEVLRRFFAVNGESFKPSDVADDYLPGDIVSYHRPQNNGSQSHIAIVSNAIGVSGRPLIVHNRGWGPQLEDALFVDQITGHYRYSGQSTAIAQSRPVLRPRRATKSQLSRRAAADRAAKASRSMASEAASSESGL